MQKKMEIFQSIRRHLTLLGIVPTKFSRIYPFNWPLFAGFSIFIFSIISSMLYLVYTANTIMEYIQCFCIISASIGIGIGFFTIVLKKMQWFDYIENFQELINKRK